MILVTSCMDKNKYRISGQIENANNTILYLERIGLDENTVVDSVQLNDKGKFTFKGNRLNEPTFFKLRIDNNKFISLLLDSCTHIEVLANMSNMDDDYTVKNSFESNQIKVLNRKLRATRKILDSLTAEFQQLSTDDQVKKFEIQNKYLSAIDNNKKFIGSFVMDNPRSFVSYYALFQKLDDNSYIMNIMDKNDQGYFKTLATSLNIIYPESERVKQFYNYVYSVIMAQRRQEKSEELLKNAKQGIPEIAEKNPEGDTISLSSLRGKLTLLSFWASWDDKSRQENKNLKGIYKKFKNKGFEIYQVSLDQNKILWELAIKEDGLDWINVSDLKMPDSYPAKIYNIRQLPANYLISPEGEIIGKDLFGYRLEEKLEELLR